MEHVEFTYMTGMDREEVEARLRESETGVLSLAAGGEAYGIPLAHYYEGGDSILFRLGVDDDSEKVEYLESTTSACYTIHEFESHDGAWSVLVRGPVYPVSAGDERFDVAEVNRRYPAIHVFDEDVADVEVRLYELQVDSMTGRKTVEE